VCCWAGADDEFNNYEKARAWFVYTTIIVLAPIYLNITYRFIQTRANFEMKIREPNVIILVSILALMRMLLEAMHQLTFDLDLAKSDWKQFQTEPTTSTAEVFYLLSWICLTLSLAAFFYRAWLFWFKSVAAKEANNFGERRISGASSEKYFYTQNKKLFGNPQIVLFVCGLWLIAAISPVFVIIYRNNGGFTRRNSIIVVGSSSCLPLLVMCIWWLRGVKNRFGVIVEYKIALLTASCYCVLTGILEAVPSLKHSYYKLLIDFELFAIIVCIYLLWLKYFIYSYSLKNWFATSSLSEILGNKDIYEQFREHAKETLCAENLMFLEDIYIHRKSLDSDPFLELSSMDQALIKECATVDMHWVDEKVQGNPDLVPSSKDIYELYIKPLAVMEVNIPGRLRKELISEFNDTPKGLVNISLQMMRKCSVSTSWVRRSTDYGTASNHKIDICANADSIPSMSIEQPSVRNEPSIRCFYPAWKNIVLLLKNDYLLRFCALNNCSVKEHCTQSLLL